ncbi:hypothetical protein Poly51_48840 [Rubripirellula tenax]|uniref:Uncharacterized protein n=2 Tax=Rubripirellula tenax TaxID=2528015 RepID=A0A5C6EKH4_9BACT|nr:hypothetical protein Poly51_48840 [Rubripirellula tenax]
MRVHSTVRRVAVVLSTAASVINLALAFYIFRLARSRVSPGEWRQDMDTLLIVIYIGSAIGFAIGAIAFRYGFFYTGLLLAAMVLIVAVAGPFVFDPSWGPAQKLFR